MRKRFSEKCLYLSASIAYAGRKTAGTCYKRPISAAASIRSDLRFGLTRPATQSIAFQIDGLSILDWQKRTVLCPSKAMDGARQALTGPSDFLRLEKTLKEPIQ